MICLSIKTKTPADALAIMKKNPEADLFELRLDSFTKPHIPDIAFSSLKPKPVILTCRSRKEGGLFSGTEKERIALLKQAIATGADYVDVEYAVAPQFGSALKDRKKKTKIICSYHDFNKTPADLLTLYTAIAATGCDVVKIVTMATSQEDNLRMFALLQKKKRTPLIAFCMGVQGIPSRILCCAYGSYLTFASHGNDACAPGQLSLRQMLDVYEVPKLTRKTKVYGIIGNPVLHSLSPLIHNLAFRIKKIDAIYLPFHIEDEKAHGSFMRSMKVWSIRGLSVTHPYKLAVMPFLDTVDVLAQKIGAVNTLYVKNGRLSGANTDAHGIVQALCDHTTLEHKKVVILGAGGAARAASLALKSEGAQVTVLNRTPKKAAALAAFVGCNHGVLGDLHAMDYDILINATPVGMEGKAMPVSPRFLKTGKLIMDMIYFPQKTPLLKAAEQAGCLTLNGMPMLLYQAQKAFSIWIGKSFPLERVKQKIQKMQETPKMQEVLA